MRCPHLTTSGKRCKKTISPGFSGCDKHKDEKTLYDDLGGIFAISLVVDHFSDALLKNSLVGRDSKNPHLKDWSRNHLDRLPGLKFMRTLWLASIAGGPYEFCSTKPGPAQFNLENPHAKFHITSEEFDAVAKELASSLDHFKIAKNIKDRVLEVFAEHKLEVISPK